MKTKPDPKNAEVTKRGIKNRGSPVKGDQKTVVVNETPMGKIKKNLLYAGITVQAAAVGVGIVANWTDEMVHAAYPCGFLFLGLLLLVRLTKME